MFIITYSNIINTNRKTLVVFATITLLLVFSGCATTFDPLLLQPTAGSVNPQLPKLELQQNDAQIRTSEGQELTANSKFYTLLDREMPNLCEMRGESYGYIDPAVTILESQIGWGYYAISGLTLWTINLLGFPIFTTTYVVEIDVKISDKNEDIIWRKTYYKKDKVTTGLYYNLRTRGDEQLVILFREIMIDLKADLQKEGEKISNWLIPE